MLFPQWLRYDLRNDTDIAQSETKTSLMLARFRKAYNNDITVQYFIWEKCSVQKISSLKGLAVNRTQRGYFPFIRVRL